MTREQNKIKYRACLLALLLCMELLFPNTVSAAEYYSEGNFQYVINGESVSIHAYFGSEESVVIPAMIAELPVTEIENYAFSGCTSVTSITLPETVAAVGDSSFTGAKNLQKIYNQSKQVTPKVGAQVLVIEDYPVYAQEPAKDSTVTDSTTDGTVTDTTNDQNAEEDKQEETGTSPNKDTAIESEDDKTNADSSSKTENRFQIEAEEIDDESTSVLPVPETDKVVSVDDSKNLILIDDNGEITVLDRDSDYTMAQQGDGTVAIVDSNGNEIQIENGTVKNSDGDIIADLDKGNEPDSVSEKTSEKSFVSFLILGVLVIIGLAGGIVYFKKRKEK